jgi:hypothetical protein
MIKIGNGEKKILKKREKEQVPGLFITVSVV